MKPVNLEKINHSFAIQAQYFESEDVNFTREDYLDYTISCIGPKAQDIVLEAAAGTCVCGRSFAPLVQTVVCLDATLPMLEIGREKARSSHLENMIFVKGCAEELPFLDESFDLVFSRLAFHHFADTETVFSEMVRVLRPGGRLVLIDMEAAKEELRDIEDEIETLRDPSHVRNMSKGEMLKLFASHNLTVKKCDKKELQQKLKNWLALTNTPENIREEITERMKREISGGKKTGFSPYIENKEICFNQKWILIVGNK